MHANHVYKRRKLRNSVALLSEDSGMGSMKGRNGCHSSLNSECISLEKYNHYVQRIPALPVNTAFSVQSYQYKPVNVLASKTEDTRDLVIPSNHAREGQEQPENKVQKLALEYNGVNDSCSSSKSSMGQGSASMKIEVQDVKESSINSNLIGELSGEHVSAKGVCIPALVSRGHPGDCLLRTDCTSEGDLISNASNSCLSCKVCGFKDNPLKMLICDLCEKAFHLSCCKVKNVPVDEWYCYPCLRKKPELLSDTISGKLFYIMSEKQRKRMLREKLGPILYMLEDTGPYTSPVRIGKDFQAEVPEWICPISDDDDYFSKPLELDPAECCNLNGWNLDRPSRSSSIGNWLQCRRMIYNETNESDEGVACGKWRSEEQEARPPGIVKRAPLFVSQTEDWDCSCAVLWDPIHADCAVPQELETTEVLKQLKYIELLKSRLTNKK